MIKNKILTILPLTENYSKSKAGAVSLFIKDNNKFSKYNNFVVGSTNLKDSISKNYKNFKVSRSLFSLSKNIDYSKKVYKFILNNNFNLIEVHNRPQIAAFLIKKGIKNLSLFFCNDPLSIRGSKLLSDRKFLINNCQNIYFISNWVRRRFFENLKTKYPKNIIYHGCNVIIKKQKKDKIIIFSGKLNKSKGYDIFCETIIKILNEYKSWKSYVIGSEPREKFNYKHKRLFHLGWLNHEKVINYYKKSSISVVNSNWDEPFGRVAVESAATGNAVIITNKGGLPETTKIRLLLNKNNKDNLYKKISLLIENPNYLKKIQNKTLKEFAHYSKNIIDKLDRLRDKL
jgi:glycosyltransferase involved in cell wall biosynthesis